MTRIQEPDLLIDHDSGGGGARGIHCKRFLGGPVVEPFAYSGVAHNNNMLGSGSDGASPAKKSGALSGKWFPFSSSPKKPCSGSSCSKPNSTRHQSQTISRPEKAINNNNNNNTIILDMLDDESMTRWPNNHHNQQLSSCPCPPTPGVPGAAPTHQNNPNNNGLLSSTTKLSLNSSSNCKNKVTKHSKNSNSNNQQINNHGKNNCSITSNNGSVNNQPSRINNTCTAATAPAPAPVVRQPHITSSATHYHHNSNGISDDEDAAGGHLIIRYIHCMERPNKKQLVTLGLITVVCLVVLIILLALFVGPTFKTRTLASKISSNSSSSNFNSDTLISSDITNSLNIDDGEGDDSSDSYDDDAGGDTPYYSSTTTSKGLDLRKVSKLSWDLLNSNQDASSRGVGTSSSSSSSSGGSSSSSSRGGGGGSLPPLSSVSSGGEGEIILPAKMIYTSSGDSSDLMPSEHTGSGGAQNKKRSCCRTQKYSQVIKRDGCEPLTIVNKMCFGQCVSVWVPGLFASFPVCRPSKSTFKTVTLTCGRNGEKRKRVRIEKVRRCSCMEIEPTAASL